MANWAASNPLSWSERRRRRAEEVFEFWKALYDEGHPELLYDPEADILRFLDGRFAVSRSYADWGLLPERGFVEDAMVPE